MIAPRHEDAAAARGPRVLLLGASGRLGAAIVSALRSRMHQFAAVAAPSRTELALDPARPQEAADRWLLRWPADVVVNCIAISDVDRCEREPVHAWQLNAALPTALARTARDTGARLVHFSSDFVFDGDLRRPYREDDPAKPISVYGATKLDGEHAIVAEVPAHWIFRVSWLYGAASANLASDLLAPRNARRTIRLADDRFGTPNPVQLLAAEVVEAITEGGAGDAYRPSRYPSGIWHLSCHGATTWYEFGVAFVEEAIRHGLLRPENAPRIEAIREATLQRPARRPAWSALDPRNYERCFARTLPEWRAAIRFALAPISRN